MLMREKSGVSGDSTVTFGMSRSASPKLWKPRDSISLSVTTASDDAVSERDLAVRVAVTTTGPVSTAEASSAAKIWLAGAKAAKTAAQMEETGKFCEKEDVFIDRNENGYQVQIILIDEGGACFRDNP